MNRFSTLTTTTNENTSEPSTLNFNNTLDNTSSLFLNNNNNNDNESDSDSISEDSRKIRKKRNTYQKIPDDIRMELLESVKNGETLKSAAKRFKVNYSSAKSILHTYRKEGRILKKSAQERTTKKKVLGPSDTNMVTEEVKPEKKKSSAKSNEDESKLPQEVAPFSERHASVTTCASLSDETSNHQAHEEFNENFIHLLKMDPHDDNRRNVLRKLSILSQDLSHMHLDGNIKTPNQKNLEDFFANHADFQFPENDHVNHGNYNFEEPSSFSYLMGSMKRKASIEDLFQDPNNFLYSRGMTPVNAENKSFKFDNKGDHNENGEACPLKSFLDIQGLLKEAFRKTSVSYTGNPGFRKNSFDMF